MRTEAVFIGLGSNIGDSETIVEAAMNAIDKIDGCSLVGRSSLYRSAALGEIPQDDYINAVARLDTSLEPMRLLLELQAIESAFYRYRDDTQRWGPRAAHNDQCRTAPG